MTDELATPAGVIHTVLGPVPAGEIGVIAPGVSLLSVLPGAQYAFDVTIDRAEVFDAIAAALAAFRDAGGSAVIDASGMFHGRDPLLFEALSRTTGVHIVASTGMGPEELLGGYFLTPQTNPPTPWPAERFADLFSAEVEEGVVVPRVERRAPAGLVVTAADPSGMTPTEESLFRAAARTALRTGVATSLRWGVDPTRELDVVLSEGLAPGRVLLGDMDRRSLAIETVVDVARAGVFVGLDHVGWNGDAGWDDGAHLTDAERVSVVSALIDAGCAERIILSGSATGVARGVPAVDLPFADTTTRFADLLAAGGVADDDIRAITVDNPQRLFATLAPSTRGMEAR